MIYGRYLRSLLRFFRRYFRGHCPFFLFHWCLDLTKLFFRSLSCGKVRWLLARLSIIICVSYLDGRGYCCYRYRCYYRRGLFPFSVFIRPSRFQSPILRIVLLRSLLPRAFRLLCLEFLVFFVCVELLVSRARSLLFRLCRYGNGTFFLGSNGG